MSITRSEALRVFFTSKEKGTAIGIRLKGRPNLLITLIDEITGEANEDTLVVVKNESIYGEPIQKNCFQIHQIQQLFNLRISFNDPFYSNLRSLRNNIRNIRQGVGLENRFI